MKIKTSELNNTALSYAVAIAEGYGDIVLEWGSFEAWAHGNYWDPVNNWDDIGPIIDREKYDFRWLPKQQLWCAYHIQHGVDGHVIGSGFGPTLSIAACRCYVASKLGEEIDIPEELA